MKESIIKSVPVVQGKDLIHVLLGSLYIAFIAQFEIPSQPIPVTLQTFGIFSLALAQGSKKSLFSLLLYLLGGSLGLPVFAGAYCNPLWFLLPSAGFCFSFPLAAYLVGKATDKKLSTLPMFLLLCLGQGIIYALGVAWLTLYIGLEQALKFGLYPFILFDLLKMLVAASGYMAFRQIQKSQ